MITYIKRIIYYNLLLFTLFCSCKKQIEVETPSTSINSTNVFTNDATATSVLTGIYTNMSNSNLGFYNGGFTSISLFPALSADELTLYNPIDPSYSSFYKNDLASISTPGNTNYWNILYSIIFVSNSAIEGLENSVSINSAVRQQLIGEAKFIRAFCYFYLINLFGDVPLLTTTNWKINATPSRYSQTEGYNQIIYDLKDAQLLLSTNYLNGNLQNYVGVSERVRPTYWAATALLARAYLYVGDWTKSEEEATKVINNSSLFSIVGLNNVFLKNSNESIWQLQPVGSDIFANTGEGRLFILPSTGPSFNYPVYLSNDLVNSFEAGDMRKTDWVNSVKASSTTYYFPYKYKIGSINMPVSEYIMVLRLAEQYLIRAEARANQGNLSGAITDINTLRSRARAVPTVVVPDPLPDLSSSLTKVQILAAILHERQIEFFTEWGHRWFDLKRTGQVNAVMNVVTQSKNANWQSTDQLYPIPLSELQKNPNLTQNPGY